MIYSRSNSYDAFIAIDFSGSKHPYQQKKHIAFAETDYRRTSPIVKFGFTRSSAISYLVERLKHYNIQGSRILLGFDFCYSFPVGFWSALTNTQEKWAEVIKGMAEGVSRLSPVVEEPRSNARLWADSANKKIAEGLNSPSGPFWGANFTQPKDPRFFSLCIPPFKEYRLVENRLPGCKPIFKIGGQGSVGLQSLCGIPLLARLRSLCLEQGIPLHAWPFEGWNPAKNNVLVEWYPAIYNTGPKSDKNDAVACVEWAKSKDAQGVLTRYFCPDLSITEKAQAEFEGWVLGVR